MTEEQKKIEIRYVKDTFPEYLSKKDHVAASDLKNFLVSPKYYYYEKYIKKQKEEQDHFRIGSACHELILEPHLLKTNYIISEKFDKRTKEGKQGYIDFCAKAEGKTILDEVEMEMIRLMAENATNHRTMVELIKDSHRELSCYTKDAKTGLLIRMRPDSLSQTKSTITDIKTCLDSSKVKFRKDVYSYGYSLSAAYYCDFLGRENYVFAAIEKKAPYQVALYVCNDEMMEYGRKQYRMGLDLLKWSYDNDYWCDYNEFEILKECYELGYPEKFFETLNDSQLISIL
jgi:exodeoxyribonuclease VIII